MYTVLYGALGAQTLLLTVNGAGLAMSTMDIIKLKGGDPANFLDVVSYFITSMHLIHLILNSVILG
jgi:succinyl-CoA synthetase beta subunit